MKAFVHEGKFVDGPLLWCGMYSVDIPHLFPDDLTEEKILLFLMNKNVYGLSDNAKQSMKERLKLCNMVKVELIIKQE